jgi:hypothetical protein
LEKTRKGSWERLPTAICVPTIKIHTCLANPQNFACQFVAQVFSLGSSLVDVFVSLLWPITFVFILFFACFAGLLVQMPSLSNEIQFPNAAVNFW